MTYNWRYWGEIIRITVVIEDRVFHQGIIHAGNHPQEPSANQSWARASVVAQMNGIACTSRLLIKVEGLIAITANPYGWVVFSLLLLLLLGGCGCGSGLYNVQEPYFQMFCLQGSRVLMVTA